MRKTSIRSFRIDGILSLMMFGIFSACLLLVLLAGARSYGRMAVRDDQEYTRRTTEQFLEMELRRAHDAASVTVGTEAGGGALFFQKSLDGESYTTVIYCYDGWLREYFTDTKTVDEGIDPEAGEKLLEAESLHVQKSGSLLTVTFRWNDQETTLTRFLGEMQEVQP